MIENDYYLNGNTPSLKNNQYLTVLFENELCNYLVKYKLPENNVEESLIKELQSGQEIKNVKMNTISQRNINYVEYYDLQEDSSTATDSVVLEDLEKQQISFANQKSEVLLFQDIQGIDKSSYQKSLECSQYIMTKQIELQQILIQDPQFNVPTTMEYELLYLQEQLNDILEVNNNEKKRISECMNDDHMKYLQIDDLEKESREVYDIVKWNTIIRYMQVGYGEKSEEILLTYIKNDTDQENDDIMQQEQNMTAGKNDPNRRNKIFQQICRRNTDGYIEIDCKICFNNYSSESNPVVYCSLCSASFHQFCYGIKEIPNDDFLCDLCLFRQQQVKNEQSQTKSNDTEQIELPQPPQKKKKKEHRLLCQICQKTGFPMVDVNHKFYHVSCLIFLNLIYIKDSCISLRGGEGDEEIEIFQQSIQSVVVKSEFDTYICAICQKRLGFKIKCNHPNCTVSFHTHCAYIDGLHFDITVENPQIEDLPQSSNPSTLNQQNMNYVNTHFSKINTLLYCPSHQPIKDRDEILQIYLRRYGINLYKTAIEFKDYNSFYSEHEDVLKELKFKIEDTRRKVEKEIKKSNNNFLEDEFDFMNEFIDNHDEDITQIFGDTQDIDKSKNLTISSEVNSKKCDQSQTQNNHNKQCDQNSTVKQSQELVKNNILQTKNFSKENNQQVINTHNNKQQHQTIVKNSQSMQQTTVSLQNSKQQLNMNSQQITPFDSSTQINKQQNKSKLIEDKKIPCYQNKILEKIYQYTNLPIQSQKQSHLQSNNQNKQNQNTQYIPQQKQSNNCSKGNSNDNNCNNNKNNINTNQNIQKQTDVDKFLSELFSD